MARLPLRILGNEGLSVISVASFIQMPVDFGSFVKAAITGLTLNVQTLKSKNHVSGEHYCEKSQV